MKQNKTKKVGPCLALVLKHYDAPSRTVGGDVCIYVVNDHGSGQGRNVVPVLVPNSLWIWVQFLCFLSCKVIIFNSYYTIICFLITPVHSKLNTLQLKLIQSFSWATFTLIYPEEHVLLLK